MPALLTSWRRDLAELSPSADPVLVDGLGTDLLRRWAEPHRRYHTTVHLAEMLRALEELQGAEGLDPRDVALGRVAAWFHDAVYAVALGGSGGSGEAESAALAAAALPRLGLDTAGVATVVGLVEDTVRHAVAERTGLRAAFHDADLWILASEPDRFDEYCAQVREEYAAVPDELYAAGRRVVLTDLVQGDHLYLTAHARSGWEERGRRNLARELARL